MGKSPILSFIIPVFNKKILQLKNCLISINKINISKEILIIDDGSDKELSQNYQKVAIKYRAKYFYKENGGVSSARNLGLKKASGKYITFIDADDECNISNLNILNQSSNQCFDMYIFSVNVEFNNKNNVHSLGTKDKKYNIGNFKKFLLKDGIMNWVFAKIYLRSFLQKNNIKFNVNIISGEDWDFIKQILQKKPKVFYCADVFYTYHLDYENSNGRVLEHPSQSFHDVVRMFKGRKQILDSLNLPSKEYIAYKIYLNKYLIDYVFSTYLILILNTKSKFKKYNSLALRIIEENINDKYTSKIESQKIKLIKKNNKFLFFLYYQMARIYNFIKNSRS